MSRPRKGSSTRKSSAFEFVAQSCTHGELGDSQHSSRQSFEHRAGCDAVPWLAHTLSAASKAMAQAVLLRQTSHSAAVRSAQQASHGAAQKPVAGAAHGTASTATSEAS